ncbi:SIMPL domain-containing protein [Flavobacterium sp. SUN046]|uniref:SIMPL domain-containing protein n=1 Tax=Flavobacterium sp. SUN046 TaxID=3002440 RepID=UPI002DB916B6|nr:SIMPL domain-containing protein [Flavobacterium sp. SUN046]MEC4048396.1 SIMPL domain-containing protein [Flavobacterium sp. SUN046]
MKKTIFMLISLFALMASAQQTQPQIPQVTVSGEGKVRVKPDFVVIKLGVQNTGKEAAEVKKLNDETMDKVIKFIKAFGVPTADYQTTNVSLNKNYNYEKKTYNYVANQSLSITLKDVTKYDALMMGLVNQGINDINEVEFKSTKIEEYESTARKEAIKSAKHKAEDYAFTLGQKVGKAILISDNNSSVVPMPMLMKSSGWANMAADAPQQQTLAVGEIEVTTNVTVSFILD